jgi:signal transduction histidine kinase
MILARATSGESRLHRCRRWLKRHDLFAWSLGLGLLATGLITASMVDFVRAAMAKDEKVQEVTLKGELAQFLLATTQEDGSSILENPRDFAATSRAMAPVELKRPFFTYFLTTGNAATVSASNITWEPPRACAVDFIDELSKSPSKGLRACFAVVPTDASGRYIYFALRYPSREIVRHEPGQSLDKASSLTLALKGETSMTMRLMFEQPKYAKSRFPSQLRRFLGLHELTAYSPERSGAPLRGVQGQAYERRFETPDGTTANYVTLVGRIDAGLLFPTGDSSQAWSRGKFRELAVAAQAFEVDAAKQRAQLQLRTSMDAKGTALQSIEQAYLANVQSRAVLKVHDANRGDAATSQLWSSADLQGKERAAPGAFQRLSNEWATTLVRWFELKTLNAKAQLPLQSRASTYATLEAEPVLLPDLAARAFLGLSGALVLVVLLGIFWLIALKRLRVLSALALASARMPTVGNDMNVYAGRRDEIGMLGRTFSVLVRRYRSRNATIVRNARTAERRREERVRQQEEQFKARHDVLRAIGHEIKTPLQALLHRTDENSELRYEVQKMSKAVEALYWATSVESGIMQRQILSKVADISHFLSRLCTNHSTGHAKVLYEGPTNGITAYFDAFALDDVFSNVLDNAKRHMGAGTAIKVGLLYTEDVVEISVYNVGAQIPESELSQVFDFRFTTENTTSQSMGLGLFAARIFVLGMGGFMRVANAPDGVTFYTRLPRAVPTL